MPEILRAAGARSEGATNAYLDLEMKEFQAAIAAHMASDSDDSED